MRDLARHGSVQLAAVLATILGVAVWAPGTAAAESQRGQKWQFSFPITYVSSVTIDGQKGTTLETNDDVGWGFGAGYDLDEHFLVGGDFTWLNTNYDASIAVDTDGDQVPDQFATVGGNLKVGTLNFYGQWNILKHPITPFVRAGLGWTWIDSNIPAGPREGNCWWGPWYGYYCDVWQPTYSSSAFSYGGAAGLHMDVGDRFFFDVSYNVLWIDFDKADTTSFDGVRANLGWRF